MRFAVIPSEARNPSSIKMPRKERFLTSQTPFGMTNSRFFSRLLGEKYYKRLMHDATQAAPNPLSIFTTVTLDAHEFSIPSSAATPPKLAP